MNLNRASNPNQAFVYAQQAIRAGQNTLRQGTASHETLAALSAAGKDILRKRSGLNLLPKVDKLHGEINQVLGQTWYERETTIDTNHFDEAVEGVSTQVHRICQTVTRHNQSDTSRVSHRYLAFMVRSSQNLWEESASTYPPTKAQQDQFLNTQHLVFPAETMPNTTKRIQESHGDISGKSKILLGIYWDIESLAAQVRAKVFGDTKTIAGQSALWVLDTRLPQPPPLAFTDGLRLNLTGENWAELVRPHVDQLWKTYMVHPEDRDSDSPLLAHQHLNQSFQQATGASFRIN